MRCGLYGKLPAKRDFIALGSTRDFLSAWEPWLQGGLSASRGVLGEGWQAAFLRAPIWRFWLGADICGSAVLGAFMPSVDGVGRYFPLTVFALAEAGEELPPPELDDHEEWFTRAEELLLSALSPEAAFEETTRAISQLPSPDTGLTFPALPVEGAMRLRGGALTGRFAAGALGGTLAAWRVLDHGRVYGSMTYLWTVGGEGFAPSMVANRRLPDPYLFAGLLTGQLHEQ